MLKLGKGGGGNRAGYSLREVKGIRQLAAILRLEGREVGEGGNRPTHLHNEPPHLHNEPPQLQK